jgi:hypothetical protein
MLELRRPIIGEEADNFALDVRGGGGYQRLCQIIALHPNLVHADLSELGMEGASRCGKNFDLPTLNSRLT